MSLWRAPSDTKRRKADFSLSVAPYPLTGALHPSAHGQMWNFPARQYLEPSPSPLQPSSEKSTGEPEVTQPSRVCGLCQALLHGAASPGGPDSQAGSQSPGGVPSAPPFPAPLASPTVKHSSG